MPQVKVMDSYPLPSQCCDPSEGVAASGLVPHCLPLSYLRMPDGRGSCQAMVLGNFQCMGVLQICMIVGLGPAVLVWLFISRRSVFLSFSFSFKDGSI